MTAWAIGLIVGVAEQVNHSPAFVVRSPRKRWSYVSHARSSSRVVSQDAEMHTRKEAGCTLLVSP
jgi:hypothetical protein